MVLAFTEWWRNSIRERSVSGQAKARIEGRFPGRRPSLTEQQRGYIRVERSKGVSQRELAKLLEGQPLDHPTGGRVVVEWKLQPLRERVVVEWKLQPLHEARPSCMMLPKPKPR